MIVLHLELESCDDCPYRKYNGDYGRSYDSGWDCRHDEGYFRIVDDKDNKKGKWPWDGPFPSKCPLLKKECEHEWETVCSGSQGTVRQCTKCPAVGMG